MSLRHHLFVWLSHVLTDFNESGPDNAAGMSVLSYIFGDFLALMISENFQSISQLLVKLDSLLADNSNIDQFSAINETSFLPSVSGVKCLI